MSFQLGKRAVAGGLGCERGPSVPRPLHARVGVPSGRRGIINNCSEIEAPYTSDRLFEGGPAVVTGPQEDAHRGLRCDAVHYSAFLANAEPVTACGGAKDLRLGGQPSRAPGVTKALRRLRLAGEFLLHAACILNSGCRQTMPERLVTVAPKVDGSH